MNNEQKERLVTIAATSGFLYPCPICGSNERDDGSYTFARGESYRFWNLHCSDCGERIAECESDRNTDLAVPEKGTKWLPADIAWNTNSYYAWVLKTELRIMKGFREEPFDDVLLFTDIDKDEYGDLMEAQEWIDNRDSGGFIPYDGDGYWCTSTQKSNLEVWDCETKPEWATHVLWYNK